MGAAREGFNLFHAGNRANIFRKLRKGWHIPWRLVYEDTIMPLVCKIMGHVEYDCSEPGESGKEWACRRCHRFTRFVPRPLDPAAKQAG